MIKMRRMDKISKESFLEENMYSMEETVQKVTELGRKKVDKPFMAKIILGFLAGALVAFAYLTYIIVTARIPGLVGVLIGASIFPVGIIVILVAGGELITSNMTIVSTALFNKEVSIKELLGNWAVVTLGNFLGSLFVVLVGVQILGMLNPYVDQLHTIAEGKMHYTAFQIFVSGVMCNWFVGFASWMSVGVKDMSAKIFCIWFPVMLFALLGFQHSVANIFLLLASNVMGGVSIGGFIFNFTFAYLGNIIGGGVLVGLAYTLAARHKPVK